jgi:hypothetical protein
LVCLLLSGTAAAGDSEDKAKQLFADGIAAQRSGDDEGAQKAFADAYALKRHYKIAANLGAVETKLGRYREAATHLDEAIALVRADSANETGGVDDEKLAALEKMRKAATRHVVSFSALPTFDGKLLTGCELWVDDASLGELKLGKVYYLLPGDRTIVARAPGVSSVPRLITGAEDKAFQLDIALRAAGTGRPLLSDAADGDDAAQRGSLGFFLGMVAVTTVVPAVIGAAATVAANSSSAEVAEREANIASASPNKSPFVTCLASTPDCDAWREARSARTTSTAIAVGGFALAGAGAIVSAMYALWPLPDTARASLTIGPRHAGFTLRGSF